MTHIQIDNTGTPRTINQSVKVKMIAQKHILGEESVDEIAAHYSISVSDVYAALAYYYDNKSEIDSAIEKAESKVKELGTDGDALRAKIEACMKKAD